MTPSLLRSFLAFAVLVLGTLSARAQLTFTATGTATSNAGGYLIGQSYTFVYTTGTSFANNTDSTFTGQQKSWGEEFTTENQLFTSISGSGVLGTFVRPTATTYDPFSQLFVGTTDPLFKLQAATDVGSSIGLTTLDATPIKLALVNVTGGVNFFTGLGYVDPVTYFASNNYGGSYGSAAGVIILQQGSGSTYTTIESFNITSLAITTPIPEPATYAALLGLGALGFAVWRRRGI